LPPDPGVRLSKGEPHCVLQGGKVTCYGTPASVTADGGPGEVPGIDDAQEVTAASEQYCVRRASGAVTCWGFNHHGQLGLAVDLEQTTDVPLDLPMVEVGRLATSHHSLCGITASGQAVCWGGAYAGPIGDPSVNQTQTPIPVAMVPDAVDLAMSIGSACAVRAGGTVVCWPDQGGPEAVPGVVDAVNVAVTEPVGVNNPIACALRKAGNLVCWTTSAVVPVPALSGVVQIAGAVYGPSICGRTGEGQVFCLQGASQGAPQIQATLFDVHDAVDVSPGYRGIGVVHADGTVSALNYQGLAIAFPLMP
jgi:hypothetical protein